MPANVACHVEHVPLRPPGYFVTMRRGGDGVGAAGEITNVTHVFQPSGRFSAANSL